MKYIACLLFGFLLGGSAYSRRTATAVPSAPVALTSPGPIGSDAPDAPKKEALWHPIHTMPDVHPVVKSVTVVKKEEEGSLTKVIDEYMERVAEEKDEIRRQSQFYAMALIQLMQRTGMTEYQYQADYPTQEWVQISGELNTSKFNFFTPGGIRFSYVHDWDQPSVMFTLERGFTFPWQRAMNLDWDHISTGEMWSTEYSPSDFPLSESPW